MSLPSPATGDPIGRGAVTGLALIGGSSAIDAIGRVLGDNRRNNRLGAETVERVAEILGADAAQPLQLALTATSVSILGSRCRPGRAATSITQRYRDDRTNWLPSGSVNVAKVPRAAFAART